MRAIQYRIGQWQWCDRWRRDAAQQDPIGVRVPAAIDDLGFGEDYELLAATRDPQGFDEIGRCEAGEGVALLLDGRPLALRGYEHFA